MAAHLARLAGRALARLLGVSIVTYVVFDMLPSGRLPAHRSYFGYLKALALHLDLGYSAQHHAPVRRLLVDRLGPTLSLLIGALVVIVLLTAFAAALPPAVRRSRLGRAGRALVAVMLAAPPYWLGLLALYGFASDVGKIALLPGVAGYASPGTDLGTWFTSLIMPWLVLAAAFAAAAARLLGRSLERSGSEPPAVTLRATGQPERVVHARVAAIAARSLAPDAMLEIGALLGGVVLVETVFGIPGIGRLAFDAIGSRDLPVVQGVVVAGAAVAVLAGLAVDLIRLLLDTGDR